MKYTKKVLPNGLRLVTVPMRESQTAMVMVLVEAGSEYESKNINGLSHFLEHMCFKGTTNRTGEQIAYELDSLGADNNAFTGETYTGYFAKARHDNIDTLIDIISDLYLHPTFPAKDIDIERGVILEEMNMYEDMPMRKVLQVYTELLFPDQAAGRPIIGPADNIKRFQQNDFMAYHRDHYVPQKTVVVISGKFDEKKIQKLIQKTFGAIKKGAVIKKPPVSIAQTKPAVSLYTKKSDQTHIVVGFRAFDIYDKRNPIVAIAATILGVGMSSRLFKKMRDELGICYYVRTNHIPMIDHGHFMVSIGTGHDRAQEAIRVLLQEFKKLRDEPVPAAELQKAKEIVLGGFATGLETSDAWAMYYGDQELFHQKIKTPEQYIREIKKVTAADIRRVLKDMFVDAGLNLAIVGPQTDKTQFEKIISVA